MAKTIIVIHGRATKPRKVEKRRLMKMALINGLNRVDSSAAKAIGESVSLKLAYYGDVTNALLWAHRQRPKKPFRSDFLEAWSYPFEEDGSYDTDLKDMLSRPTNRQTKAEYLKLRREVRDKGLYDEVADFISPIADLFGVNDEIINAYLPDLGAYFQHRVVASLVRHRLQRELIPELKKGNDVCVVAHSMGAIVAYEVLWKFSRMNEYEDIGDKKVGLLITLGSPLGDPAVFKQLYDSNEPDDGRYPTNIEYWENFSAEDDFISRDERLADNFRDMVSKKHVRRIRDHLIYTFWVGYDGLNPHKLYGYLDNKKVASIIAAWINA